MKTRLFLEYLPWLKKPEYYYTSKLESGSWSADDVKGAIESDKKMYDRANIGAPNPIPGLPETLVELYGCYDLRNLNFIGGTFFWSEPRKLAQGWGFADMSEVNLVVAPDGKVEAYWAHPIKDIPGSTDCICALANSLESYLEALFCAQFQQSVFIRGFPDEDPIRFKKTILVAKQCALIAGGYEYYDFWAGLLGLPDTDTIPES